MRRFAESGAVAAGRRSVRALIVGVVVFGSAVVEADEPTAAALRAWDGFVKRAEQRLQTCGCETEEPQGTTIDIPGGTIHRWRGSVTVKHITVDEALRALMFPGTPPPQAEVLESRILARSNDRLSVYIRMTRRALVTVTCDTEHDVEFTRLSPALATSRSVATKIRELDGGNRGFLWRLNSYWRYTQADGGVVIDLESLSLSRRVPGVVRPIAGPVIARIGRESIISSLESLRRFLEARNRRTASVLPGVESGNERANDDSCGL